MFIIRLFVFNLLYNEVLSQALSRYLRKQQATFSQNALTGQCLKTSLHEALTSVNNIAYDSLCAQHCLAHAQCLSVCYEMGTDICYLHDVDMKTLRKEDFVYRYDCLYMDTVFRDVCNEVNSCYPYRCFSHGFYRSDCMANLYFSNEVLSGNAGGVKFIKLYGHGRFAIVSQAATSLLIVIKIGDTNFVGDTMFYDGWMSDIVQIERNFALSHSFIFLTGDGKIRRTPRIGTIDNFEQYVSQSIRCSYIALLPIIHEYLCIGISDNKLYKINANTGTSEVMNVGQVTCVQNHKGKIYALQQGKRAVFVREGDKWLTYAQPVSQKTIKSFKIIFNGEIYAQFDADKHVYQWTGNEDKWTDVSRQDCESYEVEREFICVLSNGSFVYHDNFVPQPSLHFPFKHQNGTRIPYGRGTDDNGKQYVDLTASVNHAEIGIDQFGKGYVLASSYERVVLGKFNDNHFSQPIGRALTITCWVRLVLLDAYNGGSFSPFWTVKNINGKEQGIHLYITEKQGFNNVLELGIVVIKQGNVDVRYQETQKKTWRYWTHVAAVIDDAQNVLQLFINGTSYGARRSFPYSHNFIMNAAIHNGKGGYFSDMAIWDLPLNDHQIKQLVKSDMENDEWRRDLNFVTARSCEELQRQQPYTISGYYWVFYDNKYKPVWCDMKTDGGGWTRISYLTEDKKSTEEPVHNLDESNILTDHWVTGVLLKHLYNIYPFKQIRFACDAPGGLRMDFATPLEQWEEVINYFVKEESNVRINVCGLEIMETDNSYLSYDDFDCSKFTDQNVGKEGIANDRIFQLLFSYGASDAGQFDPNTGLCQTGGLNYAVKTDRVFTWYIR